MNPHDDPPEDPQEDPQAEWKRIKELFAQALEIPASEQRAWLLERCPDEPQLIAQVLSLLDEDRTATRHFLESPFDPVGDLSGRLLGRFFLVQRIAEGGMGIVYLARDEDTGKRAAVKILHDIHKDNKDRQDLFMREARLLGELDHPNVVRVLGHGEDASLYYVAMEFVEGHSLHDYMRNRVPNPAIGFHDPSFIARMTEKLAEALDHCHARGILHRDIKPLNIMITPEGEPILVDFGLAKEFDKTTLSLTVGPAGSLEYMSPEQALFHLHKIDHRTDIFSLGVVFYELLAHHHPYRKAPTDTQDQILRRIASKPPLPLQGHDHEIPPDLGRIALKALRQDRDERFQTAGAMAYCLAQFRAGRRVQIPEPPLPKRIATLVKNHRVSATVLLMLPLLIFFGIAALAQPFMKAYVTVEVLNHSETGEAMVRYQALSRYPDGYEAQWQPMGSTSEGKVGKSIEPGSYRFSIRAGPDRFVLAQRILGPAAKTTIAVNLRPLAQVTQGMIQVPAKVVEQSFAPFENDTGRDAFELSMKTDSFWIDERPVTVREYLQFLEERHPDQLAEWPAYKVKLCNSLPRLDFYEMPATSVSWYEAREYAEWAGKRLPEAWEWAGAAQDSDPKWWEKADRKLINLGHKQVMVDPPKTICPPLRKAWSSFEVSWFFHGRPCNDPEDTMVRSANGFYQAIGNIYEWTMTARPITQGDTATYRPSADWAMLKGTPFWRKWDVLEVPKDRQDLDPIFMTSQNRKGSRRIELGFRCAKTKTL